MKKPKKFNKAVVKNLMKDWEGQQLLSAFSMEEFFEIWQEWRKIKATQGLGKAQEYLNQKAEGRMTN